MSDDYEWAVGPIVYGSYRKIDKSDDYWMVWTSEDHDAYGIPASHVKRIEAGIAGAVALFFGVILLSLLLMAFAMAVEYAGSVVLAVGAIIGTIVGIYVLGYLLTDFREDIREWSK